MGGPQFCRLVRGRGGGFRIRHRAVVVLNKTVVAVGIEGKAMNSIVVKNAYLRKYIGADINEKRAALEADYPVFWDELSNGITNVCAHEYQDNVEPPTLP